MDRGDILPTSAVTPDEQHCWQVLISMPGPSQYILATVHTPEHAAELVRVLCSARTGAPAEIVVRTVPL